MVKMSHFIYLDDWLELYLFKCCWRWRYLRLRLNNTELLLLWWWRLGLLLWLDNTKLLWLLLLLLLLQYQLLLLQYELLLFCDRLKCRSRQGPILQRGELEELGRVVREVEELHGVARAGAAGDGELV